MLHYKDADEYRQSARVRAHFASKQYEHTYTSRQRAAAQTFVDCLRLAYSGTVYVNYRKQFISVKLCAGAHRRDRVLAEQIRVLCAERGHAVVSTPQGTIYRLTRQH